MEYPKIQISASGGEAFANLTITCSSEAVTDTEVAQAFVDAIVAMPQFTSATATLLTVESAEVASAND